MVYVFYAIYNLLYLVFTAFFFLYANTYLNSFFIPDSLRWKDGHIREDLTGQAIAQCALLLVEGAILAYFLWMLNQWFLSTVVKSERALSIANWTMIAYLVLALVVVSIIIYASFK